jgi:hypothetical protein
MASMTQIFGSALVLGAAALTFGCSSSSTAAVDNDAGTSGDASASDALPKCSGGKDAFDTYGAAAFVKVNQSIFANVTAESKKNGTKNLGTAFTKIGSGDPTSTSDDLAAFEGNLAAFLVYAYGGPTTITYTDGKTYTGPQSMESAHKGLAITSDQYDYFVMDIVVPALITNGVSSDDVSSCFAPVITAAAFKASIVGQ